MSKNKITINLDKSSKLKFENVITGTDAKPSSFFIIPLDENIGLVIKGKDNVEGDKVISEISIPPLKDYIKKSKIVEDAKFNVQVSKSLFTPWKGILEMKLPLEVDSCLKEATIEEDNSLKVESTFQEVEEEEVVEEACNKKPKSKTTKKKFTGFAKLSEGYI